ncbi:MAG: DUF2652 domain-containing protein [Azospira oryzae]|nr:MAG: DUF2652 domain-containing protein [Azospira oryzae]
MTLSINHSENLIGKNSLSLNGFPNRVGEGLVFIPDISGFTHFVESVDIQTGSQITADLLSVLVNSNRIGLTVSEIEGDAVLFYRYGQAPTIQEILDQALVMQEAFQSRLLSWGLIQDAVSKLSLKLIVHYGPLASISVGNAFNKLYGRTVLEAHQLLKNDIDTHSYLLLTEAFLKSSQAYTELDDCPNQNANCKTYKSVDHISYAFLPFQ